MLDTNKVCLYTGLLNMLETLVLWLITLPKHTGGAPLVLLVLLLGSGDGGGVSISLRCLRNSKGLLACVWFCILKFL